MVIWHFEKLYFWINFKEVLNWLNSASGVELKKSREKSGEMKRFFFD